MRKFTILIILMPILLFAQEYSFDNLVEIGLKQSFTAQNAALTFESTASQLKTAKWNLVPEANLNLNADQRFYNPSSLPGSSDLSSSFGLSISKAISLNDASWFNYRYAKLDKEIGRIRLDNSLRNYVYQLFGAYLDVLNSERQLLSLQENLRIQTRIWEQSKAMLQQGRITDFEVKQNEIAVMNSRIAILRMQNTIDKGRNLLFGMVGTQDEGFPLTDFILDSSLTIPELQLDNVDSVRLLKEEIKRNDLTLRQRNMDYLPQVTISYGLSRSVSGYDFDFDKYSTNHGVGLNISYSLWNQFRNSETAKRAKISSQMTQLSIADKKDEVTREYNSLSEELKYLRELDVLYADKLEQAEQQIRIAEERYKLGMIQQLELDKTRSEYLDADIAYSSNHYQILAKREALNYLLSNKILGKW